MPNEIDRELDRLATDVTPEQLCLIEFKVLERVAGHQFASPEKLFRMGLLTSVAALAVGVFAGTLPVRTNSSSDLLTPLLESRLAPSTLLGAAQ